MCTCVCVYIYIHICVCVAVRYVYIYIHIYIYIIYVYIWSYIEPWYRVHIYANIFQVSLYLQLSSFMANDQPINEANTKKQCQPWDHFHWSLVFYLPLHGFARWMTIYSSVLVCSDPYPSISYISSISSPPILNSTHGWQISVIPGFPAIFCRISRRCRIWE